MGGVLIFLKRSSPQAHQTSHTSKKSYRCSHCNKVFVRKFLLILHWRIHMGEEPYKSGQCGKNFHRELQPHTTPEEDAPVVGERILNSQNPQLVGAS